MSAPEETKPGTTSEAPAKTEESATSTQPVTYTEMASNAASSAGNAAAGVKDSMFSMFGGGAKKEKKEDEVEGEEDRSGSSKAKKDAEAEKAAQHEDGEPVISSPSKPSTHALRPSTGFLLCEVLILFLVMIGRCTRIT